ncbi:MAG: glyoxylate/hydroxypyruvate reductase A [Deltaproteobacteria bacterium]
MKVLYAGDPADWPRYQPALTTAFTEAGLTAEVSDDLPAGQVDYIIYAPNGGLIDFAPYTRVKAVLSLWAGVEKIVTKVPAHLPLTRMVDQGLKDGMVEWVTGQVLRHHLGLDPMIRKTLGWVKHVPPLARHRSIGILGLGELGRACAQALAALNFDVHGYSRHAKTLPGITTHSGPDGLKDILNTSEILVLLLPNTPATENTLNAETLALLPKGAVIINPGRGALIDDDALLAALDTGHIQHATLDVFRIEPLPENHPFWSHPHVTVSPHIAAETRPETASQVIVENIRRHEAGERMLHLVDRQAGY